MSKRKAFDAALKANRYDTATRMQFAIWLEEHGQDDEAVEQRRMANPQWVAADEWMHALARHAGQTCLDYWSGPQQVWHTIGYEDLLQAGHRYLDSDGSDDWIQRGDNALRNVMYQDDTLARYWTAWEIITGRRVTPERRAESPFSCSC